jgi:hypothetical protein
MHYANTILHLPHHRMNEHVPIIFDNIFPPTLDMITVDFTAVPDHRKHFFKVCMCVCV